MIAPEAQVLRHRVRVVSDGHEDIRHVLIGEGRDGWLLWAQQTRFDLDNTRFITVGDAVYRTDTIDRIEPVHDTETIEPSDQALQAALGALTVIRDAVVTDPLEVRGLCAQLLQALEQRGIVLVAPPS